MISWSHDPMSVQNFPFYEKKGRHTPFFKKDATFYHSHLFVVCIFFFLLKRHNFFSFTSAQLSAQLSTQLSTRLSAWILMLPNLTNHYIKLSDGDLQCEWNSDIFLKSSASEKYWDHESFLIEKSITCVARQKLISCSNTFFLLRVFYSTTYLSLCRMDNKPVPIHSNNGHCIRSEENGDCRWCSG